MPRAPFLLIDLTHQRQANDLIDTLLGVIGQSALVIEADKADEYKRFVAIAESFLRPTDEFAVCAKPHRVPPATNVTQSLCVKHRRN